MQVFRESQVFDLINVKDFHNEDLFIVMVRLVLTGVGGTHLGLLFRSNFWKFLSVQVPF